jgi:hypothetical protein
VNPMCKEWIDCMYLQFLLKIREMRFVSLLVNLCPFRWPLLLCQVLRLKKTRRACKIGRKKTVYAILWFFFLTSITLFWRCIVCWMHQELQFQQFISLQVNASIYMHRESDVEICLLQWCSLDLLLMDEQVECLPCFSCRFSRGWMMGLLFIFRYQYDATPKM